MNTSKRAAALLLAAAASAPLCAQDASIESPSQEGIEEITVTGSRIARKDFVASSPITTVSADTIAATGAVTAEAALNQLPQFTIGANQTNAGFGGTGQASLNLRGLGAVRNLVLLDGKRLQPSDVLGWIDVNTIPPALIDDVEIISGGASAVYGSDAIAGVVNFRLNPRFEGIAINTQYNQYDAGDGATLDASITGGGNFAGDRGNAVVSLSYTDREDVGYMSREFFQRAQGGTDFRIPTGIYRPNVGSPPNLPSQAAVDQVFAQYGAAPGRVPRNTVLGYNDDGTLFAVNNVPFNYRGPDGLLYNTGTQLNNLNQFSRLQVPLTRYSALARATYEVAPKVEAYGQLYYTSYDSLVNAEAGNDAFSVPVTNPWIPDDLATILASRANPTAALRFEKRFQEEAGPRNFDRTFDTLQFLAGFKGSLDAIDGSWEVYGSHGNTKKIERNQGSVLVSSLNALLNAPDGGLSLCEGGYNPFGLSQISADCRNFLVATPISQTDITQDVIEATVQGRAFELPAGDLRFAAGVGYRSNDFSFVPDQDLARGNVVGVFRTGTSEGSTDVTEAYVEFLAPVLRDVFLVESLELGAAYRYSDYNLSGGVDTYKADFNWQLIQPVRLRGGYQRAVRAPSVGELFVAPNVSIPNIGTVASGGGDPCHFQSQARTGTDAAQVRALCLAQGIAPAAIETFANPQQELLATSSGNRDLTPETGDTYTFGVVFDSPWESALLSRLQLSVDWYRIEIEDVIGTIGAAQILPKCYNSDGSNPALDPANFFCSLIRRDTATGWFANVDQPTLNLGGFKTAGYDIQLDWSFGADALGLDNAPGTISLTSVVSHVKEFDLQLQANGPVLDYSGTVGTPSVTLPGSIPDWKAVTTLGYQINSLSTSFKWRFIDAMRNAARVTNANSTAPNVESYNYFDWYARWGLNDSITLEGGVNNLTDRGPPLTGTAPGSTQASTYDIYGRQYYLALNLKF